MLEEDAERRLLEEALAVHPGSASGLRRLAVHLQIRGEHDHAEALWRRFVERRPDRAGAWLELARIRLDAGERDEALALAERGLSHADDDARPFGIRHQLESLAANLRSGSSRGPRHILVGGAAFCGSTLTTYLLGAHRGVANVGESHFLVMQPGEDDLRWIDFERDDPATIPRCTRCGPDCTIVTDGFRKGLLADPVDWYARLAEQYGVERVVSSDKYPRSIRCLDPLGRFDLLVLFRHPTAAWNSTARKPTTKWTRDPYLRNWDDCYRRLSHHLIVQGRRYFLHFDRFRLDPQRYLRRVAELLGLPADEGVPDPRAGEIHCVGGNARAHGAVLGSDRLTIDRDDPQAISDEDRRVVDAYAERSTIFQRMLREHEATFEV